MLQCVLEDDPSIFKTDFCMHFAAMKEKNRYLSAPGTVGFKQHKMFLADAYCIEKFTATAV